MWVRMDVPYECIVLWMIALALGRPNREVGKGKHSAVNRRVKVRVLPEGPN